MKFLEPPTRTRKTIQRLMLFVFLVVLLCPGLCLCILRPGLANFTQGLLIPVAIVAAYLSMWGSRLWIGLLLLSPFVAISPVEFAYITTYLHPSDSTIIATIAESNLREIHDFLGPWLIPILASCTCTLAVAVLTPFTVRQSHLSWRGHIRNCVLAISVGLPIAVYSRALAESDGSLRSRATAAASEFAGYTQLLNGGYPFGLAADMKEYLDGRHEIRARAADLKSFRFGATRRKKFDSRQIYVLVIGESSRRDHWSLFGYSRPTNPELTALSNLVLLENMITPWSASRMAIPVILTRKHGGDNHIYFDEASIVRAFSEGGFATYWLSNQLPIGEHDSPISVSAYDADQIHFFNPATWVDQGTYDDVLVPALEKAITESSNDLFVVLHTMGSHLRYEYRYPHAFDSFSPSLQGGHHDSYNIRLLNSYDNSILYTDHVLARIISVLQHSNSTSAMLYSSDHGEDLPNQTCSLSGHGNFSRNDFMIPALFWYSEAYAKANPTRIDAVRENATHPLSTENIFESLIDLGDLSLPRRDVSKSIFNENFENHIRIVNGLSAVDIDHAHFTKACQIVVP